MKRIISLFLALTMLIGVNGAVTANAETYKDLVFDKTYSFSADDTQTYSYQFTLEKSGLVVFGDKSFTKREHNNQNNNSGLISVNNNDCFYYILVQNSESTDVYSEDYHTSPIYQVVGGSKKMPCYLLSGTYTVTVSVYYADFKFTPSLVSSDETYTESYYSNNNSTGYADFIDLDEPVKGTLGRDDEEDYYSFTLSSKCCVQVDLSAESGYVNTAVSNPSSAAVSYMKFGMLNATGESITAATGDSCDTDVQGLMLVNPTPVQKRTNTKTYVLDKGTYYVKVSGTNACLDPKYDLLVTTCHALDEGKIVATTTTTYTKSHTCSVCGATVTKKYNKKANTLTLKGKTKTLKFATLKKKALTVARKDAYTVSNAKGAVSYAKSSGNSKITVNTKNGNITVKKGIKKGTYKIKVKVTAKGTNTYKSSSKTVTVTIKVK